MELMNQRFTEAIRRPGGGLSLSLHRHLPLRDSVPCVCVCVCRLCTRMLVQRKQNHTRGGTGVCGLRVARKRWPKAGSECVREGFGVGRVSERVWAGVEPKLNAFFSWGLCSCRCGRRHSPVLRQELRRGQLLPLLRPHELSASDERELEGARRQWRLRSHGSREHRQHREAHSGPQREHRR